MIISRKKIMLFAAVIIVAAGFFLFWEEINLPDSETGVYNQGINYEASPENRVIPDTEKELIEEGVDDAATSTEIVTEIKTAEALNNNQTELIEKKETIFQEQEEIKKIETKNINIAVPFTTQAPLIKWDDPRQQDGCEEAVSVMAMAWVKGEGLKTKISAAEFETRILALSDFQAEKYGEFRDTSLSDMETWIFKDYFSHDRTEIKTVATTSDIISALEAGKIILLPMAGRELKNPNFKAPGPLTHMILIKGYDYQTREFVTNDPGTRLGADYRYPAERIYAAIWVYPTGYHQETATREKAMLVVSR